MCHKKKHPRVPKLCKHDPLRTYCGVPSLWSIVMSVQVLGSGPVVRCKKRYISFTVMSLNFVFVLRLLTRLSFICPMFWCLMRWVRVRVPSLRRRQSLSDQSLNSWSVRHPGILCGKINPSHRISPRGLMLPSIVAVLCQVKLSRAPMALRWRHGKVTLIAWRIFRMMFSMFSIT